MMLKWKEVLKLAREGNHEPNYKVRKSPEEWRAILDEDVFTVTRLSATERPFSSEMCEAFTPGRYACACCEQELFDSSQKFESASGWPSFDQPLAVNAVAYVEDGSHGMQRIETKCNVCDAHLGHVFPDGKTESGLRYCINGKAIRFIAN